MFRNNLYKIISGIDLSAAEMSLMINEIFLGKLTDAQIGAFMAALATKGETFEELAGAANAMREKAIQVHTSAPLLIDTCGTGGDAAKTFNISTTAAFVAAGCGVTVAKHGNRSVSSKCGSADLLEAIGVKIDTSPEKVGEALDKIGIGFLFAPIFHGAMRYAARARKEIGLKSIFNMIGPLTNPAGAHCQLIGVYAPDLTDMFANALKLLGSKHAFIVHGHDGLDEVSVCAPTRISELKNSIIKSYDVTPEQFGLARADQNQIAGGDLKENADITLKILSGEKGAGRDVVIFNAAFALVAAGRVKDVQDGIAMAADSIDKGAAMDKLTKLIEFTRENG